LRYLATSVEDALGKPVDRWDLLGAFLRHAKKIRPHLTGDGFIQEWNAHLALRGQWVSFTQQGQDSAQVKIIGISKDGCLILENENGTQIEAAQGEIGMPTG
jgi:BirA family biotin operon repressor/biotin-[acetyl-CoA-carboxylase] ligase